MGTKPEQLYLELLKKVLAFTLWPEFTVPIEIDATKPYSVKRFLFSVISNILKMNKLKLVKELSISTETKIDGRAFSAYADTMIGIKRLDNLQFCIETVINDSVEGDLVEAGVWRGGACIFMRAVLSAYGIQNRRVFVVDSFCGLPEPDAKMYPADKDDKHCFYKHLAVSQDEVANNFRKYGLLDDKVLFLSGWFKDTLPKAPIGKISILRLDADMYGSTMEVLDNLYPKLSPGGFCIIDDYGALGSCQMAVDDYRKKQNIKTPLQVIDWTGRYWRKE